jgi:DNA-directed RNA polymerase subunit RPC12/RpoP
MDMKNYFKCFNCGHLIVFGNVVPATQSLTCPKCGSRADFVGEHKDYVPPSPSNEGED